MYSNQMSCGAIQIPQQANLSSIETCTGFCFNCIKFFIQLRSCLKNNSFYSTVTKLSPLPTVNTKVQHYLFRLTVQIQSSNLWTSPYSSYQTKLFNIIREKHENEGLNFKQISNWFNENDYLTPRGKIFKQNHVWSIYMKKQRSINRFSREYDSQITDIEVNMVC